MEAAPPRGRDGSQGHGHVVATKPLLLGALACVLALARCSRPAQAAACNRVAAPGGSDSAAGTVAAPYATFKKLAHSLAPGQTGCLRGGTYRENVEVNANGAPGAPITIQSYPGRVGDVPRPAHDRQEQLVPDLPEHDVRRLGGARATAEAELKPSPTVHGESISFIGNEVTNRHTAICFAVGNEDFGRAPRVVIRRNRIHDCGQLPPTNHEHGIYLHSPCCAQVTDNWVYDNADTGDPDVPGRGRQLHRAQRGVRERRQHQLRRRHARTAAARPPTTTSSSATCCRIRA